MKKFKVKLLSAAVLLATSALASASGDIASLQKQIDQLKQDIGGGTNNFHMAGYATVQYQAVKDGEDAFNQVKFAPIFMYQMNDKISFEGELEISVEEDGGSEFAMEYAYANIELTDDLTLMAGKFFIPVGNFVQNIHPSWINKAITMPAGFGHGGAAPLTDVGIQLRGGSYVGDMPINYAVYYGNGSVVVEGHGGLEVENEGMSKDWSQSSNYGGRVGILPMPNLEIGLSYMAGKAALVRNEETSQKIDLDVLGVDFVYRRGGLVLRGEYIKQELEDFTSVVDHGPGEGIVTTPYTDATWTTWYTQAAYRLNQSNWEGVVRYGDFDSQIPGSDKTQWTLGVNYYLAPSVIAKVNFDAIEGEVDSKDKDIISVQLAYGF